MYIWEIPGEKYITLRGGLNIISANDEREKEVEAASYGEKTKKLP